MFTEYKIQSAKTYKDINTLRKAVQHLQSVYFSQHHTSNIRYIVVTLPSGRVTPVFIGQDAIGVIHYGFTCVGVAMSISLQ